MSRLTNKNTPHKKHPNSKRQNKSPDNEKQNLTCKVKTIDCHHSPDCVLAYPLEVLTDYLAKQAECHLGCLLVIMLPGIREQKEEKSVPQEKSCLVS